MGKQERATCFATLLQKDLKSDVARFTVHIKHMLQQIRLLTGLNEVGRVKRATSFFNSFCGIVALTSCTFLLLVLPKLIDTQIKCVAA